MKHAKLLTVIAAAVLWTAAAHAKLNVVTTLPDLAAIAAEVGGDRIQLTSLARPTEDVHFVDAKPSFIRVLNRADVLIEGGAELELGWLPPLVENARNAKILPGGTGRMDASRRIPMLEVPTGPIDRSMGDVHAAGNPHYTMDPVNGRIIAREMVGLFSRLDRANAGYYETNFQRFDEKLTRKLAEWSRALEPYRGTKFVSYHKSYTYFAERFGLVPVGEIEPKPGVEPSPTHINNLIPKMKAEGARLVLIEPNRSRRTPEYVAKSIDAKLLVVPILPGGHEKTKDFFTWFDYNVGLISAALKDSSE
jgi:zinc/manganese transport system substrate-binding protein